MICLRPTADSPLVGVGIICFFLKRMFLLRPPNPGPPLASGPLRPYLAAAIPWQPSKVETWRRLAGEKKALLLTRKEEPI
jgi:hypothetical protein